MGRKRRKVVRLPRRRLPTVFLCPNCGREAIRVKMDREKSLAIVNCGNCGLSDSMQIKRSYGEVDAYCIFIDKYYAHPEVYTFVSNE